MAVRNDVIPFGRAVRVRNWKLWRSRRRTTSGNVEALNVSTLDGAWSVCIPSTMEMYGFLCMAYKDYLSDDTSVKAMGEAVLSLVLSNIMYVSCIGNGYFQRAVEVCATVYAHPSLLDKKDKEHKVLVEDVKRLSKEFLEWRKTVVDAEVEEPTDDDLRREELAGQAMDILKTEETPK